MGKINSTQIWEALMDLKNDVGEIKGAAKEWVIHSHNIDQHLNRLNERIGDTEKKTAKNSARIGLIMKIGGGIITIVGIVVAVYFGIT